MHKPLLHTETIEPFVSIHALFNYNLFLNSVAVRWEGGNDLK